MIALRLLLGAFFVTAGVAHFRRPEPFLKIVPPPLPPHFCVWLSGVAEILGGLGLPLFPALAGRGLILLLAAVFPANIYMAVNDIRIGGFPPRRWMQWARLPLQGVLAWLVWFSMGES